MHRQIAGKLTGRVTKWLVLGLLGRHRGGARRPVRRQAHRRAGQPGVVVAAGQRRVDPGARQAGALPGPERHPDRRGLREDLRPDQGRPGDDRHPARPDPADRRRRAGQGTRRHRRPAQHAVQVSQDRQVAQGQVTFNFGKDGWNKLPDVKDQIEDIARSPGATVYVAGPGRPGGRLGRGRSRASTASCSTPRSIVVIVILLLTYRSPILWLLPVLSAGVALVDRAGRDLPARQERRPHGQRAEPGHPDGAGLRRRHRLRPAAGGALPRRAASPRGPARGDGVRPPPGRAGDHRQRAARSSWACSA